MKPHAELDLKQLARILAAVFPSQHQRIATWLIQLEPIAFEPDAGNLHPPTLGGSSPVPYPTLRYPPNPEAQDPTDSEETDEALRSKSPSHSQPTYRPGPTQAATPWDRSARPPKRPPPM